MRLVIQFYLRNLFFLVFKYSLFVLIFLDMFFLLIFLEVLFFFILPPTFLFLDFALVATLDSKSKLDVS
jgi:hypothetical protein